ncbi:MAG: hypothetical protein IID40_06960 [Planctomycetes bacterium]|nr:hypothetical protein [Planctomycetota bacterium]
MSTVVQKDDSPLTGKFVLRVVAVDEEGRPGGVVERSAAFFSASANDDGVASVGEIVILSASFTGETGSPQIQWTQVAGPPIDIQDPSAAITAFVATDAATYVFRLEAIDPSGVLDVDLVTVIAVDTLTVEAGESKIVEVGEAVELRGLVGGGSGQPSLFWTEISEHNVQIENATSGVASFVVPEIGEYEFELAASDGDFGVA